MTLAPSLSKSTPELVCAEKRLNAFNYYNKGGVPLHSLPFSTITQPQTTYSPPPPPYPSQTPVTKHPSKPKKIHLDEATLDTTWSDCR
jgi:hypothetical protein